MVSSPRVVQAHDFNHGLDQLFRLAYEQRVPSNTLSRLSVCTA